MSEKRFFPVSWSDFHRDCKALAWRLLDQAEQCKGIVAITRGGLVPAAIIAREIDVRVIETICVQSYSDDKSQDGLEVLKDLTLENEGEGWLVIDDLVDTGKTLKLLRTKFPKAHYATVYAKPAGRPLVDSFITSVSQDTWIYFPWDLDLSEATPLIQTKAAPPKP